MNEDLSTRIDMAIAYLKKKHIIRFQKDVAERMGVDVNTVSRAKKGGDYNPESFAMRFNAEFDFIFSNEWLLNGVGEMLAEKTKTVVYHPAIIGELPELTHDNIPATVPAPFGAGNSSTIPAWADSLIYRVSENTKALESLLKENAAMRKEMAAMRSEIKRLRADLGAALHHPALYIQEQEPLPMAAEYPQNNK